MKYFIIALSHFGKYYNFQPQPPKNKHFFKRRNKNTNGLFKFSLCFLHGLAKIRHTGSEGISAPAKFAGIIFPLIFSIVFKMFEMRENLKRRISL